MSQAISRITDLTAGHCFEPHSPDNGLSSTVFANGLAIVLVGTHFPVHTCGNQHHDATQSQGSSTVFIEGKAVGRVGDQQDCGDVLAQGSSNIFCGG